jgi:hypothetical protein
MSKTQLDLEVDATGVEDQLTKLAERAIELGCRWLATFDHKTMRPTLSITDDNVIALLQQAAAVQHLLDLTSKRQ